MAYYPMLTDDELIRHISTMYQPSELEKELAARLEKLLDKADGVTHDARCICGCGG